MTRVPTWTPPEHRLNLLPILFAGFTCRKLCSFRKAVTIQMDFAHKGKISEYCRFCLQNVIVSPALSFVTIEKNRICNVGISGLDLDTVGKERRGFPSFNIELWAEEERTRRCSIHWKISNKSPPLLNEVNFLWLFNAHSTRTSRVPKAILFPFNLKNFRGVGALVL